MTRRAAPEAVKQTRCTECGESLENPTMRHRWRGSVVHCTGSRVLYPAVRGLEVPHHGHRWHPDCWSCGSSLGCDTCATAAEVICVRCCCAGTVEAIVAHGVLVNTPGLIASRRRSARAYGITSDGVAHPLSSYPLDMQAAYRHACNCDPPEIRELHAEFLANPAAYRDLFARAAARIGHEDPDAALNRREMADERMM